MMSKSSASPVSKTPGIPDIQPPSFMDGSLRKWTNYWNGWQHRWFVLEKGVLSYYHSKESVAQGCKGSINILDADISAHPADPFRLDVVVPGEQHFYLKAPSPQLRQEWIVALGSLKQSLSTNSASHLLIEEDLAKKKLCEMRLYCDVLIQQVHSIKSSLVDQPVPDVQKLDESTALLSETCDTVIQTIEECIQLASPNPSITMHQAKTPPPTLHRSRRVSSSSQKSSSETEQHASNSKDCVSNGIGSVGADTRLSHPISRLSRSEEEHSAGSLTTEGVSDPLVESAEQGALESEKQGKMCNFFTSLDATFTDIRLDDSTGTVPTIHFLDACSAITKIFDLLGSTAFAPVKMDLNGNIRKLTQFHQVDEERFGNLQAILQNEIDRATTRRPNSATDALLWLKRLPLTLLFMNTS